jgi:hypothetical protein
MIRLPSIPLPDENDGWCVDLLRNVLSKPAQRITVVELGYLILWTELEDTPRVAFR